ncbi:MAG TPA: hypothetical protein VNO26_05360 [Candidatus Limnocylindria bacterium]|nr:hypothetical protein [Candidatus Limnocylindria bacterium]
MDELVDVLDDVLVLVLVVLVLVVLDDVLVEVEDVVEDDVLVEVELLDVEVADEVVVVLEVEVLVVVVELVLVEDDVVLVGGQLQVKVPLTTSTGSGCASGSESFGSLRLRAVSCPRPHGLPSSVSVRFTTDPLVPEMLPTENLTTSTLISLPTWLALQENPDVREVQAAETRLSSSGTSVSLNSTPRTTSTGLLSDTGTTIAEPPGCPHAWPTESVFVWPAAGPASAKDNANPRVARPAPLRGAP